eukprot:6360791-Amphidinium_carterae.1
MLPCLLPCVGKQGAFSLCRPHVTQAAPQIIVSSKFGSAAIARNDTRNKKSAFHGNHVTSISMS